MMKKRADKLFLLLLIAALLVGLCLLPAAAAEGYTVSISDRVSGTAEVRVGDSISMYVTVSAAVNGMQAEISYDPALFSCTADEDRDGRIMVEKLEHSSFTEAAVLRFTAIAAGSGEFRILQAAAGNYNDFSSGDAAPAATVHDSVCVAERGFDWEEIMRKTRDHLVLQCGSTALRVGSTNGEWVVIGLVRNGVSADSAYFKHYAEVVNDYVESRIDPDTGRLHASKSTDNARVILSLTALGLDVRDVAGHDLLQGLSDTDYVTKQGVNGPIWALIALDSRQYEIPDNADADRQVTRKWLLDYILSMQLEGGGWSLSNQAPPDDLTPMALTALAPYYDSSDRVKAAVDAALQVMSEQLDEHYDWGNSNSNAQVVLALSTLGIDAASDSRFSNGSDSVLKALLRYSLDEGGFEYASGRGRNQMATEQAMYALDAYRRFREEQNPLFDMRDVSDSDSGDSDDSDDSGSSDDSGDNDDGDDSDDSGDSISVTFRLIGDSLHDQGVEGHSQYVTWIKTTAYTLEEGSTVYDLFMLAIQEAGLAQRGAENNYVEAIRAPDVLGSYWLGEFDNGPNSGWMYTINGVHPGLGLIERTLSDGDRVIWHYVDDYVLEERSSSSAYYYRWLEAADVDPQKTDEESEDDGGEEESDSSPSGGQVIISGSGHSIRGSASVNSSTATLEALEISLLDPLLGDPLHTGPVTIDFSELDQPVDSVIIPSDIIRMISDTFRASSSHAAGLRLILSGGVSIEFDADALKNTLGSVRGADITVTVEAMSADNSSLIQQASVGVRPAYSVTVNSGGIPIRSFDGTLRICVPYRLQDGETANGLRVYHIAPDGVPELCQSRYDQLKKQIGWDTTHLSLYMIGYDASDPGGCDGGDGCPILLFTDTDPKEWYHDGIHFCLEYGLMNGTGDDSFEPDADTSRAMLLTVLWRLEERPETGEESPFSDVPEGQWFSKAIAWANAAGIAEGYGNGAFGPNDRITREQFAAILFRYAQYKGLDTACSGTDTLSAFEDAASVSSWAMAPMRWGYDRGLITGTVGSGSKLLLDPQGSAVRAQTATILMRFIQNCL